MYKARYRRLKLIIMTLLMLLSSLFIGAMVILNHFWLKSRIYNETGDHLTWLVIVSIVSLMSFALVTYKITGVFVDRIKEADIKRETAMSEIEHSAKLASIGRLAAGVAHEINNPLSIISERAGLIKDIIEMSAENGTSSGFLNEMSRRESFYNLIKGIIDAVNRCRTITHRLLGFARRMDVAFEIIDINETISEVLSFLEREILFRSIGLVRNFSESIPSIVTDKGQVQQVILNIVNNAVDAVDKGGVIELTTMFKDSTGTVLVQISDNGPGVHAEQLKHIFEPFFTTKEKDKGTGLGLSISYGIIKKLGGDILVTSVPGKGTVFTVELPLKAEHKQDEAFVKD
ncbi:MAG: ATP-binding protein [Nitrospirae bacterium YQR-1]